MTIHDGDLDNMKPYGVIKEPAMTTPTDAELSEYLVALSKGDSHRYAAELLVFAADRLAVLSARVAELEGNLFSANANYENDIYELAAENARITDERDELAKSVATGLPPESSSVTWLKRRVAALSAEVELLKQEQTAHIQEYNQAIEGIGRERDRLREALKTVFMVTLPPHDVSGRAMYDKAREALNPVEENKCSTP